MLSYKMVSVPIFILFFAIATSCAGERIKLESKKHILCITEEKDSPIYVYPPVVEDAKNDSILIERNEEFWNDWELKNSKDVRVPMVEDKRWENFETIYTDHIYFPSVVAFSVSQANGYTKSTIKDLVPENTTIRTKREARYHYWGHQSSTLAINDTGFNDFTAYKINISTRQLGYWKIHDYNLRWAGNSSETETVVPISPDDASCVVLYTYICPYCNLNITVGENIFQLKGSRRMKAWTSHSFSVNQATNITLSRSTTGVDTTVGKWAIDIRRCPLTKSNKRVYEVSLEKDIEPGANRSCMFLLDVHEEVKPNTNIFNCDRGLLGRGCDISCEKLLGSKAKYCQQHQICDNSLYKPRCHCVGYGGPECEAECGEIETGECRSSASILNKSIGLLMFGIMWATLTET